MNKNTCSSFFEKLIRYSILLVLFIFLFFAFTICRLNAEISSSTISNPVPKKFLYELLAGKSLIIRSTLNIETHKRPVSQGVIMTFKENGIYLWNSGRRAKQNKPNLKRTWKTETGRICAFPSIKECQNIKLIENRYVIFYDSKNMIAGELIEDFPSHQFNTKTATQKSLAALTAYEKFNLAQTEKNKAQNNKSLIIDQKLTEENQELKIQAESLKLKLSELETQLEEAIIKNVSTKSLRDDNKSLKKKNALLNSEISRLSVNDANSGVNEELISKLKKEKVKLSKEVNDLKIGLTEMRANAEKKALSEQIKSLKEETARAKLIKENRILIERVNALKLEISEFNLVKKKVVDLKAIALELADENNTLSSQLKTLNSEVSKLKLFEIKSAEKEAIALQLTDQNNSLSEQILTLESKVSKQLVLLEKAEQEKLEIRKTELTKNLSNLEEYIKINQEKQRVIIAELELIKEIEVTSSTDTRNLSETLALTNKTDENINEENSANSSNTNNEEATSSTSKSTEEGKSSTNTIIGENCKKAIDGKDWDKSFTLCTEGVEAGDSISMNGLGLLFQNGFGIDKDDKRALELFKSSAALGYGNAFVNLGRAYRDGALGVQQDFSTAITWFKKGTDQGNVYAQYALGDMHYFGQGFPQNYQEAAHWYRLASSQGEARAQYSLGYMYDKGQGVSQDLEEALRFYTMAAEQGNRSAKDSIPLVKAAMNQLERNKKLLDGVFEKDVEYNYYADGSCKDSSTSVCISPDVYEALCSRAVGISTYALRASTNFDGNPVKQLYANGGYSGQKIYWNDGTCYAGIWLSGYVNGTSYNDKPFFKKAQSFILSNKNEILVSSLSLYKY